MIILGVDPGFLLTGYGAIATAVAAVKAGAADYLSKPADADDVVKALLALKDETPAPPENPMSADRVRWEHIQRVYELCSHNVSETARRLRLPWYARRRRATATSSRRSARHFVRTAPWARSAGPSASSGARTTDGERRRPGDIGRPQ